MLINWRISLPSLSSPNTVSCISRYECLEFNRSAPSWMRIQYWKPSVAHVEFIDVFADEVMLAQLFWMFIWHSCFLGTVSRSGVKINHNLQYMTSVATTRVSVCYWSTMSAVLRIYFQYKCDIKVRLKLTHEDRRVERGCWQRSNSWQL